MPWNERRVLVTGATGFLGGAVARRLAGEGAEVLGLGRDARRGAALAAAGIGFQRVELTPGSTGLDEACRGRHIVFHCAALSSPWGRPAEFDEANVLATRAVVRAAGGAGVTRLIHVSTPSLYFGFHDRLDIPEDAPPADPPPNLYAASKLAAESEVGTAAAAGLATVILRPRAIFGPGDTVLFPRLLRVARRGRFPLIGRGDPWLDATYVDNVVDALLLAARAPDSCVGRTYNITNGEPWRREALLRAMFDACGLEVRWRRLPRGPVMAAAGALEVISRLATRGRWEPPLTRYTAGVLAYSQTLDLTAARRDLGYSPRVGMAQGIAHFARWWLKEGYAHH